MDHNKELLLRIASLINENKEIQSQLNELNKTNEQLSKENEKFHHVLSSLPPDILPKNVFERTETKSIRFKMATILFLDIQGFKKIASQVGSENVIDELDQIIFYFNKIAKKYTLEKIKTIGDAYMAAGGLPRPNDTHALNVTLAAIEIREFMNNLINVRKKANKPYFEIRIGIHTGPVVAGVVGIHKFAYDIWGDTVNIASRMESNSVPGKINISETTHELIKDQFECFPRGKIAVKGAGEKSMFFVEKELDVSIS